ncbi:hypothetical protein [Novosphingobium terrae]|jgi:hypothetical protein|nr:hypothetical protein [Novosphingobium terrae]
MTPDSVTPTAPAPAPFRLPMNPCDRLRLHGPIRSMPRPLSLLERILFG